MRSRHILLESQSFGRRVHLWAFGHAGRPVVVFPSNAGIAHEWQQTGMVDALAPQLAAGHLRLYCPESNVSRTFSGEGPLPERMALHTEYERFVLNDLVPFVRQDSGQPHARMFASGCSMGALYSALFALKFPEVFRGALCMSGRYRGEKVVKGAPYCDELYFNDPLSFVPGLEGHALERVRQQTELTLVVGRGPFENNCIPETLELGESLQKKGVPTNVRVWGHDSKHDYTWWRRQVAHYLPQLV